MGRINILNDAGTNKATLEFNGSSDTTLNVENLADFSALSASSLSTLTSTVTSDGTNTQITGILGIDSTSTDVENAKLYVNGGIRLEGTSPDISSATGLKPHIGTGSFSIYDGEPGSGTEVFRANNSYTFIPRVIQQHSVPVAPTSGNAYLSTHDYGTGQGDNRTHFGYNDGSQFVNYIRGARTYFDSPIYGEFNLSNGSTTARLWTQDNETGMNYGGNAPTHVWMDNAWFREATWGAERSWENYPGATCTNDTREGPIGEFRIHGIHGVSGSDFSVVVRSDGGYATGSDARRKTNVQSISNAIDTVMQLDGKTFNIFNRELEIETNLTKADGRKFGFIAQEIEDIIPEAVKVTPDTEVLENGWASGYAVDYGSVVALLTNAIKEQQTIIDDLKSRIETLEGASS